MNEENKKKIIIVAIIISFLVIYSLKIIIHNNSNKNKNYNSNNLNNKIEQQLEKMERDELERLQDEAALKEKGKLEELEKNNIYNEQNSYNNERNRKSEENIENFKKAKEGLKDKLLAQNFVDKATCYYSTNDNDVCFYNGEFEVVIKEYTGVSFKKEYNSKNLINYDCKNDIEFISNLFNKPNLVEFTSMINNLVNMIGNGYYDSFNIEIDGLRLGIYDYYDKLVYDVNYSSHRDYDVFYPMGIDLIINKDDYPDTDLVRNKLYNILMTTNKQFFSFYDYGNLILDENSNQICSIKYSNINGYTLNSSFCHGGTSNTDYELEYNKYSKNSNNSIIVNYKGNYFKEEYQQIINNSIKYFEDKFNSKINITNEDYSRLNSFVKNDESEIIIKDSNNLLEIKITFKSTSYYKNYEVEYIFK